MTYQPGFATSTPRSIWHGHHLAEAFRHAAQWLEAHREEINALNVFPVPDGDTGTNMVMTMQSATVSLPEGPTSVATISQLVTRGALLGARGNSGVILSQIFRGFADAVAQREEIDGRDLAAALEGASAMAYKAVMRPVEGTMLTVIRGAAERATPEANRSPALDTVLEAAIAGANAALDSTPDLLPILKQAGVVDAGGRGIVVILEGMQRYNRGETTIPREMTDGVIAPGSRMAFLDDVADLHGDDAFGYCTNFLVLGAGINFEVARNEIARMGQSAVIVGDDTMVKVHIHTENPGQVLDYAIRLGTLDQIKIDNMNAQTHALTEQRSAAGDHHAPANRPLPPMPDTIAIVAVAAGDGLSMALETMGATAVIQGGQTMNPSTEDLLRAVEDAPVDQVILLPNNKNIIMAANQLAHLTTRDVQVIPSISVPQGLAALASFNPEYTLSANGERMTAALDTVTTIDITRAVRDVEIDGLSVRHGQYIGLVDDVLKAAGDDLAALVAEAFAGIDCSLAELVTIFTGNDAIADDIDHIAAFIRDLVPEAEIEIQNGGQPHYHFIISVE